MSSASNAGTGSGRLELRHLIEHEELGLELLVGGDAALARRISGAHPIDVDEPSRWLQPDWILLTTGLRLRDDVQAQRDLVREASEGGLAAIGFALELVFEKVPEAMLEEAGRISFPIFSVPIETPFREIASFVYSARANDEVYLLRRSASMQRYLMEAATEANGEQVLIERLAAVLRCSVVLLSPDGRTVARQGDAPVADLWGEISSQPPRPHDLADGERRVISAPVVANGSVSAWLVTATAAPQAQQKIAKLVTEAAAHLLGVIRLTQRAAVLQERVARSTLLTALIEAEPGDRRELSHRMRELGFSTDGEQRMIAIERVSPPEGDTADRDTADRLSVRFEPLLLETQRPYLVDDRDGQAVVLIEGAYGADYDPARWIAALPADGPALNVGVGRPAGGEELFEASLRDAQVALQYCRNRSLTGEVVSFEQLDLVSLALRDNAGHLGEKVDAILEPLLANPVLYETLVVYFQESLDIGRVASRLYLHPNSVRYRLTQIERALGERLRHPATIANLYLAMTASGLVPEDAEGISPTSGPGSRP